MKTSILGIELIKHFESLHDGDLKKIGLQPKLCPANVWTVGYGHAVKHPNGRVVRGSTDIETLNKMFPQFATMTEKEAGDLLQIDLLSYEKLVDEYLEREITQNEYDALVSHTYNTGGSRSLFKFVNQNIPEMVYKWFTQHYITVNGVVFRGLQRRRQTEWTLYSTGELKLL